MTILTIEDVAETVKICSKGRAKLLSTEYVNNETDLTIQCGCGEIFERTYASLRRGKVMCSICSHKVPKRKNKYTLEEIKVMVAEKNCEYISGEYINSRSILLLRCSCGALFNKSWQKFYEGQTQCKKCGLAKRQYPRRKKQPTSEVQAHSSASCRSVEPISDKVKTKTREPKVKKPKSVPKIESQTKNSKSKSRKVSPKKPKRRKPDRHSEIGEIIREGLDPWKTKIKKKYHKVCPITGTKGDDVIVHHLFSLNIIYKQEAAKMGIKFLMSAVVNYDEHPECRELISRVVKRHDISMGILISKEVHKHFHKEYGYGNNTPEQFDEFLQKHYNTTLLDIQTSR